MPDVPTPAVDMTTTTRAPGGDPYLEDLMERPRGAFIFMRDVAALTGLPDTYIRSLIQRGEFPVPVRLDGRRRSFVLGEVLDWLERVKTEKRSPAINPKMAEAVRKGGVTRGAQIKKQGAAS